MAIEASTQPIAELSHNQEKSIQGTTVPALGFGTYELTGEKCLEAVATAIETGYRHIDTARAYENEQDIGTALAGTGISRDELFLTSKIWFEDLEPDAVLKEVDASLKALRTDYLDLVLIHWPNDEIPIEATLKALQTLQEKQLIRYLGVSNFTPDWLERALEHAKIFCNQIEFHPLLRRERLHRMALEHDLLLTAYSPLAQGKIAQFQALEKIGEKHGKTAHQVCIRWLLEQPNVAAIPRSENPDHIRENFDVWDFVLDRADLDLIESLPDNQRQIDPEFAPDWEK